MESKRFSVFDAITFGIKAAIDNFRLFFLVALVYGAIALGAIALILFFVGGIAGLVDLKALLPNIMKECSAGSQNCGSSISAFLQQAVARFPTIPVFIVLFTAWFLLYGLGLGLIRIALDLYDHGSSSVSRLFVGFGRIFKAIIAQIIFSCMCAIGFLLFVIPGIYLMLRFGLFLFFIVDKNSGIIESLKQSYAATAGSAWHLMSLLLVTLIVFSVLGGLGMVFMFPIAMLAYAYVYRTLSVPVTQIH